MSDDGLTQLFQTQFSTLLRMNLQQKTSKLRGKTEEGSHVGSKMASPIQFVPPMQMKTPVDPKSQLVARAAAACARNWDSEVIRAATAASVIGSDAGSLTTEAFDTTNYLIPANYGASTTSVGLTVDKLNE